MRSYEEWGLIKEFLEERLELIADRMAELQDEYRVKPAGTCRMDFHWLEKFSHMLQIWVDEIEKTLSD
jgi:hypothetical protein